MPTPYVEIIVALIQALSSFMKTKGLTDEEINQVFEQSKKAKDSRPSEELPEP